MGKNATNVTIYQFAESTNGPPSEIFEASVLTNENGSFIFSSINGSASNYLLKPIQIDKLTNVLNKLDLKY